MTDRFSDQLPSQRHLFDMPREICFLTAASWCPMPRSSVELGKAAVERKSRPWELAPDLQQQQCEDARRAAAKLINAEPSEIALVPSIGYGVATAAKALDLPAGANVIVLEDDHSSPVLEWSARPDEMALNIHTVHRGADGDWTSSVLETIENVAREGLALVSISNVHWADGGLIDMDRISAAARQHGAMLLIDATHAVGVIDMDVKRLKPDFLLFPTYKWLVGPYGRAFLYVSKAHHGAMPLEQTMSGRKRVRAEDAVYFSDLDYVDDASRFDMGERDFFITMEIARNGMEVIHKLGRARIEARLAALTSRIAEGLLEADLPVHMLAESHRAPNILSLSFPGGMPEGLGEALSARKIYCAPRLGHLRIAPHIYNDEQDCDTFVASMIEIMRE